VLNTVLKKTKNPPLNSNILLKITFPMPNAKDLEKTTHWFTAESSLGRYVFGSEISYNKAPPRLPGLAC
jgi:hypothetical protein